MSGEAARMTDNCKHTSPHCHAPIHPPAPAPTPMAHSCIMEAIMMNCAPTVMINNMQAATVMSQTMMCMEPSCIPGGPGMISMGEPTVLIANMPAARKGDMVAYASCVGPIPGPMGKIDSPCSSDVKIGS
jgi:uncharacterized Zn-binding protein involved in type VI secretion